MIIKAAEDILKPSVDTRSYRYVELKNGMKCFLCFDPTTEKSAACCSVQVGSMCDPVEAQGLAHFLEVYFRFFPISLLTHAIHYYQ